MLVFQNKGLIPIDAITISGVSVKVGDNPIGVFGTGLKYACAIILRLGGEISIFRGTKELKFGILKQKIRGEDFHIITMNGKKLGMTDRLGLNWEPWMAYRELYSNMLDEGGQVYYTDAAPSSITGIAGHTTIAINCKEMHKAHEDRAHTILLTEPTAHLDGVDAHMGRSEYIYYKKIRVHKLSKPTRFTYNITKPINLTEDRTVLYPWEIPSRIVRAIIQATDKVFLHEVLHRDNSLMEGELSFSNHKELKPSTQFMEVADSLRTIDKLCMGAVSLFKHYQDTLPGYVSPYMVELTEVQNAMFIKAIEEVNTIVPHSLVRDDFLFKSQVEHGKVGRKDKKYVIVSSMLNEQDDMKKAVLEAVLKENGNEMVENLINFVIRGELLAPTTRFQPQSQDDGELVF